MKIFWGSVELFPFLSVVEIWIHNASTPAFNSGHACSCMHMQQQAPDIRTARKPMDRERNRVVRQQRKGDMKKRAVGYEDPAKPVWVSAPFIAVAATTAFLIAGHLLSRRPGVPVEMEETEVKEEREPIIVLLFQVVTTTTIIR
jgi:uncharacterized membrane protein